MRGPSKTADFTFKHEKAPTRIRIDAAQAKKLADDTALRRLLSVRSDHERYIRFLHNERS